MTGSQQNFERGDTAPLNAVRGGHGGSPERATPAWNGDARSEGAGEERTRPTFPPPERANHGQPQHPRSQPSHPQHSQGAQPPGPAPSGPIPGAGQVSPPSDPTRGNAGYGAFGAEVPNGAPGGGSSASGGGITPLGWAKRALLLCAVSVVSGLLWVVIKPSAPPAPSDDSTTDPGKPRTAYDFAPGLSDEPANCAEHSTGKISDFFADHPCEHLTRALYTTQLENGEKVLTSVVTVRMPDAESAEQLERMATRNATGNIEDLVTAGRDLPEKYPSLSHDYGYDSKQRQRLVVIGESSYFGRSDSDDGRLKNVTTEALKLGAYQDKNPD
ncbi:hypothetical protein SAMN04487820_10453 [Actinopolyspora mzabensis]|uniref:Uncharacterized protein n=1 Tax=Actinopolyspora mzabensis TaxID=995066 RepID=A0A1G8YT43_ACTMZ|nr:hypothetical protein SAMN04487820_10453 [Actinopolyspora mzabensis]